jgi:hypothetical protein
MAWSGLETHQREKYKENKCAMNCILSLTWLHLVATSGATSSWRNNGDVSARAAWRRWTRTVMSWHWRWTETLTSWTIHLTGFANEYIPLNAVKYFITRQGLPEEKIPLTNVWSIPAHGSFQSSVVCMNQDIENRFKIRQEPSSSLFANSTLSISPYS